MQPTSDSIAIAIVAEMVDLDRLPPSMRQLCKALGAVKAFELCRARGGVPLCVPTVVSDEHWLVPVIGLDGLELLVVYYGGIEIEVPKYDKVAIQLRHKHVQSMVAKLGLTATAIATGYTKRHVLNIKRDLGTLEELAEAQGDLFGDGRAATTERPVERVDDEHRKAALEQTGAAHNPFGMGKQVR